MEHARKWVSTVLDQALFAGSNFVLNVLLIHSVSDEAYGAYAVAFSIFLLLGTVHTGLFTEPMLVFGAGRFKGGFRSYLALLGRGHVIFGLLGCLALAACGLAASLIGKVTLGHSLYAAAVAQPFILYLWMMRRACYVHLKPLWSAIGGLVYAAVLLGGVYVLGRRGLLSVPVMFGIMALGSMAGGAWIALFLRRNLPRDEAPTTRDAATESHRSYGGWAVATGFLAWLPTNIPFLLLEFAHGSAAPGILKAMLNFIMPAAHAYAALSILLVPLFVSAREEGRLRTLVVATAAVLVVCNVLYWLLLGTFGSTLVDLLYGGNYVEYAGYLWLAGLYPIVSGVAVVVRTALRALERPNDVFWSGVAASVSALTLTAFLIVRMGVLGALIGISINMAVELVSMYLQLRGSTTKRITASASTAAK